MLIMSSSSPLYDAELQSMLEANPDIERKSLLPEGLQKLREDFVSAGLQALCEGREIAASEWTAPARDGHSLEITSIKRADSTAPRALLFHIHSGGMIAGDRLIGMDLMADFVEEFNLECASVEYRLAPENPDPIPVHDCFDGLVAASKKWKSEGNTGPVIIAGMSAGGGLAAGVSLLSRDLDGPKVSGQLLMCPMLDESNATQSSKQFSNIGLWDRESNDTGWNALLGDQRHSEQVTPYASPSAAQDLGGLPPTFLDVGTLEVFRSEIVRFAERLALVDVPVELHMWSGAFHGFDLTFPEAEVSQLAINARKNWLERLLKGTIR